MSGKGCAAGASGDWGFCGYLGLSDADAPGTSLADVVLLCGALETPLDGGSIPVKVGELFVAESLIMRYLLDNKELATIARDKTSTAMVVKLL